MLSFLLHALVCSMCCVTIYAACRNGMILFPIVQVLNRVLNNKWGEWIKSPIYGCLSCMCSFWGITYYLITFGQPELVDLIKFILVVGFFNFVVDMILGYIEFCKTMANGVD